MWLKVRTVLGTMVALLLVGGVAAASVPDVNGVIHGCRKNTDGSLRVIDTAKVSTCPNGYTALDWSQTGPQGPAGPAGPAGVSGWEIVTVLTPIDAATTKGATAYCPPDKVVLGGGGFTGSDQAAVTNSFAQFGDGQPGRAWEMSATKLVNDGASWRLVVQAICANAT
jgi:hypothetical protein